MWCGRAVRTIRLALRGNSVPEGCTTPDCPCLSASPLSVCIHANRHSAHTTSMGLPHTFMGRLSTMLIFARAPEALQPGYMIRK